MPSALGRWTVVVEPDAGILASRALAAATSSALVTVPWLNETAEAISGSGALYGESQAICGESQRCNDRFGGRVAPRAGVGQAWVSTPATKYGGSFEARGVPHSVRSVLHLVPRGVPQSVRSAAARLKGFCAVDQADGKLVG